ncbi:MAG: ComEC family competence protein, partial [Rhodospirillales bacterium]|nr:ComEC family competence protein [Rhodospirillales bacterium]
MLEKANNPNPYVAAQKTSSLRYLARNFFRNLFYYDYHRWVLWLPVFMAFGIGLYFTLNFEPVWYLGFCILGTLALFARVIRHSQILFMLVITLCFVALGFSAAQFRTARVATTSLQREIGPLNFSGRVMQMETMPTGSRVILENLQIDGPIKAFEVPERVRIRINTSKGESFRPGDWIKLYGVLRPPSSPASPHAFDFQRYAFFKGIGGVGFSMSIPQIIRQAKESNAAVSFNLLQSQIRQTVSNHIRNALPNETGAVATALITGEKKGISRNTMEAIRDAGLAHLLAISGLHIGLVAGLVFYIVRALLVLSPGVAVRHPIKTWAALAALIAAFGYTLLAGSTIPTLRAFTMMAFVLGAITMGRRGITLRLVAVAAIVILLFQPESLLGASFQLSFAAVTGLVATYEAISRRYSTAWRKRNIIIRMLVYLGGVGLSTFIAGLATAPFAAYHFHQLASYGVLANLFAVPATALWIMPSAVLGVVLMPLGRESIGLVPMGWGIDAVIAVA